MQGVYLFHFASPISDRHTTQHYIGYADDIDRREATHRAGAGARLTQVAVERGIDWQRVRVWDGADRQFERKLKNRADAHSLCPICSAGRKARKAANDRARRARIKAKAANPAPTVA